MSRTKGRAYKYGLQHTVKHHTIVIKNRSGGWIYYMLDKKSHHEISKARKHDATLTSKIWTISSVPALASAHFPVSFVVINELTAISEDSFQRTMFKVKSNKSCELDLLPFSLIKAHVSHLAVPPSNSLNVCLTTEIIHLYWKCVGIKSIPAKRIWEELNHRLVLNSFKDFRSLVSSDP